ncbi:unnamed protein product, partial [Sphacelaria rigidula]
MVERAIDGAASERARRKTTEPAATAAADACVKASDPGGTTRIQAKSPRSVSSATTNSTAAITPARERCEEGEQGISGVCDARLPTSKRRKVGAVEKARSVQALQNPQRVPVCSSVEVVSQDRESQKIQTEPVCSAKPGSGERTSEDRAARAVKQKLGPQPPPQQSCQA